MFDIVEYDFFKFYLFFVIYLRLDGSIFFGQRYFIVFWFNNDLFIDVLLFIIYVGGLGFNLIGVDMVVFVEYDWNFM